MSGQTNWAAYDVPLLAGILDEDLSGAWEQVGAWFSAQAMLDDASSRLQDARDGLAVVWPPEKSPTATVFFRLVDRLTESMKTTSLASNANGNALYHVLTNQDATKTEVDRLHSTWSTYQRLGSANQQDLPDATEWQGALNQQAQQHMATADEVINEYAATLVVPQVVPVVDTLQPQTLIPDDDGPQTPMSTGRGSSGAGTRLPARVNNRPARHNSPVSPVDGREPPILSGGEVTSPAHHQLPDGAANAMPLAPLDDSQSGHVATSLTPASAAILPGAFDGRSSASPGVEHRGGVARPPSAEGGVNVANGAESAAPGPSANTASGEARTGYVGAVPTSSAPASRERETSIGRQGPTISAARLRYRAPGTVLSSELVLGADGTIRPMPSQLGAQFPYALSTVMSHERSRSVRSAQEAIGPCDIGIPIHPSGARRPSDSPWRVPTGGPTVLVPVICADLHDPGPGVFGIDR